MLFMYVLRECEYTLKVPELPLRGICYKGAHSLALEEVQLETCNSTYLATLECLFLGKTRA